MRKIPKAKCEKCKNCELINELGYIFCKVADSYHCVGKPKRCLKFKKIGGKEKCPVN